MLYWPTFIAVNGFLNKVVADVVGIGNVYGISIIEYFGIYLQSSQILEIRLFNIGG